MSGSGVPIFAATVISRLSLENIAERFLSCAPLRCMMFLNLEWPAMCGRSSFLAWGIGPSLAEGAGLPQRRGRGRARRRAERHPGESRDLQEEGRWTRRVPLLHEMPVFAGMTRFLRPGPGEIGRAHV